MSTNNVTSVALSGGLIDALTSLGVQASGFGGTEIMDGVADFGITGGAIDLDNTRLEVIHNGGLTLQAGDTTVDLTDFVISNVNHGSLLTGLVTVDGDVLARLPLFQLQGGDLATSDDGDATNVDVTDVDVTDVDVILTQTAAIALNQVFGVTAFESGFGIGTANIDTAVDTATEDILGTTAAVDSPGGATTVAFSTALVDALGGLGVQVEGFGGTTIEAGAAAFQITGGAADLQDTQVEIAHAGGLTFTAGDTAVTLSDFVISNVNGRSRLSGLVTVDGDLVARLPLFNLHIGDVEATALDDLTNLGLTDVNVTLTGRAARALNRAFDVHAFRRGFSIGTAEVDAFVETATGDVLGVPAPEPEPMGTTTVALSSDLVSALTTLGVEASGFGESAIQDGAIAFGITGGAADLTDTQVEIVHSGGLTLTAGDTEVTLTDFIITNLDGTSTLSGLVTVNGDLVTRATLFDLQLGGLEAIATDDLTNLDLTDVAVTLSDDAAALLNQVFEVTAFTEGFSIGTAQVDAFVETATGDVLGTPTSAEVAVVDAPEMEAALFETEMAMAATLDVAPAGDTSVELSNDLLHALRSLGVHASGFGGTDIIDGVADFLITGGAADLAQTEVEIIHSGGLSLQAGHTVVTLSDFIISNVDGDAALSGLVTVNGDLLTRASLFDLEVGSVETSAAGDRTNLELDHVGVSLTNDAATVLNQVFDVTAFTAGFNIGTAEVDALVG
ncbi:MAG: hypothetical protein AAFX78_03800 [Cyanobacteria bacterium J06638_20]